MITTQALTIEDFYLSGGEAIIHYTIDEQPKEIAIDSDKIVKWIKEYQPEYLKCFLYYNVDYMEWQPNEVELLKDFAGTKGLRKLFLNDYLNK